jgi:hypothetical protein
MRWRKEVKYGSRNSDIISHPVDVRLGKLLTVLIQNLQGIQGVFVLIYR